MIWVCFSRPGIETITAFPEKETFTRRFFVEKVLDDFDKERAEARPKRRPPGTFLHLDNAPTYRPDDDFDRLGATRLSHPRDSPEVTQCDFWLFGHLKTKLEGKIFINTMVLMAKVNQILMDIL
jgi:hypothetical protein